MREEIPKLKEIMKQLTDIGYRLSEQNREEIKEICEKIKFLCEILDY